MKATHLFATLLILAASAHAQNWSSTHLQADLESWITSQFQGRARLGLPTVLSAATAQNLLNTSSDRLLLKRQFRAICRAHPGSGHVLNLGSHGAIARVILPLAVQDLEYNDSTAYASEFGLLTPGVNTVAGNILAGEIDSFRFELAADATVIFSAAINGPVPTMEVTNLVGSDMWDMGFFNTPSATIDLPKGVYCVRLHGGSGAAGYSLDLNVTFAPLSTLVFGQPSTKTLPASGLVGYRVVMPADGVLDVRSIANGQDTILYLINENFRYIYTVEDDSRSPSGFDAGLNAHLPQGIYYLFFYSGNGNSISTTTTASFTAAAIPVLGTATITAVIPGGEEDFHLYALSLSQPEALTIVTGPSSAAGPAHTDAFCTLHDRRMVLAQDMDDSGAGNSVFPLATMTLPAGRYYVSSSGMYDFGGYTIASRRGPAAVISAAPGLNRGNLLAMDVAATHRFSLLNAARCEVDVVEGTLADAELFIIDANTGLSRGWSDVPFGDPSCNFGPVLPKGDYYVIVKDWDGGTGSYDLSLNTPLHRRAADRLFAMGTQGNPIVLLFGFGQVPGMNPLPGLLVGDILVDLNGSFTVSLPMANTGVLDLGFSLPPGSGVFMQSLEIDGSLGKGFFSNLLK